jgi:multidrug resistance protein
MVTTSAPAVRQGKTAAFGFVFATALMNSVSFGIMIPILPNLIKQMNGGDTAAASAWNAVFATVWGLMQFLCGPILGMLSDRYGRRPVMLISIFGLFVDFLFMALAPNLAWLFVGRVLNGITASSFSTANAYVADITPPEKRARNFGLMGSAFGFGFIIGPTIGGLLGQENLRWTPRILGFTFMATGISQILVQVLLVGPVVKRIGERGAVLFGLGAGTVAFVIYGLAPTGWIYLMGVPVYALSGVLQPGLMGLMTKRVGPTHQGQLQGAIQSLQGVASFVAPAFFGFAFAWAVRNEATVHLPGLPILGSAVLLALALLLAIRVATPLPPGAPQAAS